MCARLEIPRYSYELTEKNIHEKESVVSIYSEFCIFAKNFRQSSETAMAWSCAQNDRPSRRALEEGGGGRKKMGRPTENGWKH